MPQMGTHGSQHAEYGGALLFLTPACWVPDSETAGKRRPDSQSRVQSCLWTAVPPTIITKQAHLAKYLLITART